MDNELLSKLDNIINDLDNSEEAKELTTLKSRLLKDKDLLDDLNKLQNMDKNDKEYVKLEEKIFSNKDNKRYKELENKLYYFSLETGKKLTELTR